MFASRSELIFASRSELQELKETVDELTNEIKILKSMKEYEAYIKIDTGETESTIWGGRSIKWHKISIAEFIKFHLIPHLGIKLEYDQGIKPHVKITKKGK